MLLHTMILEIHGKFATMVHANIGWLASLHPDAHLCSPHPVNSSSTVETRDNKKMHPSREVGRFDNGESLVATG